MRVLIVEDSADLTRELAENISHNGFVSDCVASLNEARDMIERREYSLALLDRRLPDGDGVTLVPLLRATQPNVRILMLTAADSIRERVKGLDAGADDYLTKPFDIDELMARIRANLRRSGHDLTPPIRLGNLSYEPNERQASVDGRPIVLQSRELTLLESLMRRAGRVALRDSLIEEIHGARDEIHWNTLNVLVAQLRRRLNECGANVEIRAARGIGYFIVAADA